MESSAYQSASSQTTRGLGRCRTAYPGVNESIAHSFDLPKRVCVEYTWKCVFWAEDWEIYNFQQPHFFSPTPNGEYAIRHIKDGWADQKAHSYAYICTRSNWMFKVKEGRGGRVRTQPEQGSTLVDKYDGNKAWRLTNWWMVVKSSAESGQSPPPRTQIQIQNKKLTKVHYYYYYYITYFSTIVSRAGSSTHLWRAVKF